ncbi:DUF72 domain-containing protein [Dyadobacter sp. CY312]|uniref:DUF72 domain-containing protein n=1 Tax=Dyadobacter sp. CY312 TaxID=2907303 RepID=UPI001F2631AE|nr:DUF72 domain-containing protein [Dyadobacter sp. CY312]MCE7042495.1 DUF72 domain-containing protein [Dyadobacter sp. CY312]
MMAKRGEIYLGTSGLVLPYKNRQAYPAEFEGQSRMMVYGKLFNSIEINSIFYKLPRPATIGEWTRAVRQDFRFTFKLWKQISHSPSLKFNEVDVERFFEVIEPAREKAGCILVQFPPSVKAALFQEVSSLLETLQHFNKNRWSVAVEFRSPSWYTSRTFDLLNTNQLAMVYHDKSGSQSPHQELDADIIYLRFHGPNGNYKGSYDQGFLYEYAGYVSAWQDAGKTVYVYFNNTMGAALENLRTLEKFMAEDE